jgi:hypothetical protein
MRWFSILLNVKSISNVSDNSSTIVSYSSFSNWRYLSGFNPPSKIWSQGSVSMCRASHGSLATSINTELHPRQSFLVVYVSIKMEAFVTAKHDIVHSNFLWLTTFTKLKSTYYFCGPGSSVGIAIDYGLDGSGIESQWGRDIPPVQTGPGAHPSYSKMGTVSFPGAKCGRGVLLTIHPFLAPWSWKSRAVPLPPSGSQLGL